MTGIPWTAGAAGLAAASILSHMVSQEPAGAFVGRRPELLVLDDALVDAIGERPRLVLVGGEAGIGKTRLVEEAALRARGAGHRIVWGGCAGVGGLPYGPIAEGLRLLVRELDDVELAALVGSNAADLGRILPGLEARLPAAAAVAASEAVQPRLFDAVQAFIDRLTADRTVVWVFEDLHWADQSTLELLTFLVRNTRSSRALFIATYRSDELHRRHPLVPWLAEIGRLPGSVQIRLDRLGRAEIAELITSIRGSAASNRDVDVIATRSGGVPLFIEELVAASRDTPIEQVPASLRALILARFGRVDPDAQRVLEVAAAGGLRVDTDLLATTLELDEPTVEDAIRAGMDHGLLASLPGQRGAVEFRHPLIREALYDELLPGHRRRVHAAYAGALQGRARGAVEDAAATWAQLADHGDAANDHAIAFPASVRAGDAARAAAAYAEAAARYDRALELWEVVEDPVGMAGLDRAELLERSGLAALLAGDGERAKALLTQAADAVDPGTDVLRAVGLMTELAFALRDRCGDSLASLKVSGAAMELVPMEPPTRERARLLAERCGGLMVSGQYEDAMPVCEDAIEVARAVGDVGAEVLATCRLGSVLVDLGRIEEGLGAQDRACGLAAQVGEAKVASTAYGNHIGSLWVARDLPATAEHALETVERSRTLGIFRAEGIWELFNAVEAYWFLGRWTEASELIGALTDRDLADTNRMSIHHLWSALLELGRGRIEAAREHADRATMLPFALSWLPNVQLAAADARVDDAVALVADGLRESDVTRDSGHRGELAIAGLRVLAGHASSALGAGDHVRAAAARRRAAPFADVLHESGGIPHVPLEADPWRVAQVAAGAAELGRIEGSLDADPWRTACARMRALGRLPEVAYARYREGEAVLAARGDRAEAAEALREAHGLSVGMGAVPLADQIGALARRARIQLPTQEPSSPLLLPGHFEALTAREREVLGLIAQGRTNRQIAEALFISESTAGVHVSHILGKLGVAGRAEAAAASVRLGVARD